MARNTSVSRRRFVKGVAGTAAAPAAIAGFAQGGAYASSTDIRIAAKVVRVSHSRMEPNALRVGVRTSVQAADIVLDNIVLVIDGIPFGAAPADMRSRITESVTAQIRKLLARRGVEAPAESVAVQVFGGVLG
jgi:hypothetical protein